MIVAYPQAGIPYPAIRFISAADAEGNETEDQAAARIAQELGGIAVQSLPDAPQEAWRISGDILTTVDLPGEPYNISKADIYRRCTDAEAEALLAALMAAPIRLQGIFSGATMINTGDDYFPALRAGIVAALGETRADEVLVPSNI